MTTPEELRPYCVCGCGEQTKGGQFIPGHDARHKSNLINEVLAGGNDEAEAELERRGWTKFLNKRRDVIAKQGAPRERKDPDAMPATESHLYLIKAAAKILRWTGQYRKRHPGHIELTRVNAYHIAVRQHPLLELPEEGEPEPWTEWEQKAVDEAMKLSPSYEAALALTLEETP